MNIKEKLGDILKSKKAVRTAVIVGICGILLIFLSDALFTDDADGKDKTESQTVDINDYSIKLENKLSDIVESITGEECKVMVTMEQGSEYVYATGNKDTSDSDETSKEDEYALKKKESGEKTYVVMDDSKGEKALLVTEIAPKVKGVVVVCNTISQYTSQQIKQAAATVFDISQNRVCVVNGTE